MKKNVLIIDRYSFETILESVLPRLMVASLHLLAIFEKRENGEVIYHVKKNSHDGNTGKYTEQAFERLMQNFI